MQANYNQVTDALAENQKAITDLTQKQIENERYNQALEKANKAVEGGLMDATTAADAYGLSLDELSAYQDQVAKTKELDTLKALSEQAQKNVDDLTALRDETGWLDDAMERAGISTEDMAQKLADAGLDVNDLKDQMTSFFDVSTAGFEKLDKDSQTTASQFLDNLSAWVSASQSFSSNITSIYATAGSESERQFVAYLESLGSKGAQIAQDLVDGTGPSLSELAGMYASAGDESASKFIGSFDIDEAKDTGAKTTEATAGGITNEEQLNKVAAAGKVVAKTVTDSMSIAKLEAVGVGRGIVEGVAAGVQLNSYKLENQMRLLAINASNAAKRELEINSPARKPKREIGVPIVQGIAAGIMSQKHLIDNAMKNVLNITVSQPSTPVSSAVHNTTINITASNKDAVARETQAYISKLQLLGAM